MIVEVYQNIESVRLPRTNLDWTRIPGEQRCQFRFAVDLKLLVDVADGVAHGGWRKIKTCARDNRSLMLPYDGGQRGLVVDAKLQIDGAQMVAHRGR